MKFVRTNFATLNNKSPEDFDDSVLLVNAALKEPWRFNNEIKAIMEDYPELAPSEELFNDFKEAKQKHLAVGCTPSLAHHRAWVEVDYEVRYNEELEDKELPEFEGYETVYFICFCAMKSNCHTDILVELYNDISQTTIETEDFSDKCDHELVTAIRNGVETEYCFESYIAKKKSIPFEYSPDHVNGNPAFQKPAPKTPAAVPEYYWDKRGLNFSQLPGSWIITSTKTSINADPAVVESAVPKGHCPACGKLIPKIEGKRLPKYCSDSCRKSARRNTKKQSMRKTRNTNKMVRQTGIVPDRIEPFMSYMKYTYIGSYKIDGIKKPLLNKTGIDSIVKSESEKKPVGVKPEPAYFEPCECGCTKIASYKPWKPENGEYGKIGSRVLYCPNCGLVIADTGMKLPVENLV